MPLALLCTALAAVRAPAATAQSQRETRQVTLAIEHATLVPMDRDTALSDHTVLVAGGRIVWLGPSRAARFTAARRIDARGGFVIPGLADMHVHLEEPQDLMRLVDAGVTTVRNMRGGPRHLRWRDSIRAGTRPGPTIFTSGPTCCSGTLPKREFIRIGDPEDAEAAVRAQQRAGYDMIKVHSRISAAAYRRLAIAARAANMPVVGHLIPEIGLTTQLGAGQASFEHLGDLFAVEGDDDAVARRLASAGAWVGTIAQWEVSACGSANARYRRVMSPLRRAGVGLLAGTDASLVREPAGRALRCELATLVSAGLSPFEALTTATRNAGEFARQHLPSATVPFGTIAVGARADLVLLRSDPRRDITALARPELVVLSGSWIGERGQWRRLAS